MNASVYLEALVGLDVSPGVNSTQTFLGLADAFHELSDRTVRDIGFDASTRDVRMTFTFDGRVAPDEAVRRAMTIGRTAFQAAGLGTANDTWDLARWSIAPSTAGASPRRAALPA